VKENVKKSFPELEYLLEKYYEVVGELSRLPGEREENWKILRERISVLSLEMLHIHRAKNFWVYQFLPS
ncbi:MAG: hypothetical protein QXL85_07515, partial [Candidatus Bathyarchaeia archaeon]